MNNVRDELSIDYNFAMARFLGDDNGITESELHQLGDISLSILEGIKREKGNIGFLSLPFNRGVVDEVRDVALSLWADIDDFVVLGTGGSALGGIALWNAMREYSISTESSGQGKKVYFLDNIDPWTFSSRLRMIRWEKAAVNVISKSGATTETLAQFMIIRELLEKHLGEGWRQRVIITTDPERGFLRKKAAEENLRMLEIPENVGGRFSVLTPVGLLPAMMMGIPVEELLEGSAFMDGFCWKKEFMDNPALLLSVLLYLLGTRKSKNILICMTYSESLIGFVDWFRQLWAESLGKRFDEKGDEVRTGQTPIRAVGTVDQHSQLQLYLEGPKNKVVLFFAIENYPVDINLPESFNDEEVKYLRGKSLGELINYERKATEISLTRAGVPNITITLSSINSFSIGMMIYLMEFVTMLTGRLLHINPFDQPAVEQIKTYTYALCGKNGYESIKDDLGLFFSRRSDIYIWKTGIGRQ